MGKSTCVAGATSGSKDNVPHSSDGGESLERSALKCMRLNSTTEANPMKRNVSPSIDEPRGLLANPRTSNVSANRPGRQRTTFPERLEPPNPFVSRPGTRPAEPQGQRSALM